MNRILLLATIFMLSSCYVFKAYRFRKFELQDLPKLDAVPLPASPTPFSFAYDTSGNIPLVKYLDSNLISSNTYAFMVVKNDTILYERYFGDVTSSSRLPSFSVAKSFVSTLVGIALHEGYIKSLTEPITNYLPKLLKNDKRFANITIQHVLDMRSGVRSNENYTNPFSDVLKMGFANNVSKPAFNAGIETNPGEYEYKSVNTQLLALMVEKATGRKLQEYAIEKIWRPLGMEYDATWNADKEKTVRAFCCINAAARDYAKFGRLFLKKGAWQGKQIVPEEWVNASVDADTMLKYNGYKNQWWGRGTNIGFKDSSEASSFQNSHPGSSEPFVWRMQDSNMYNARYYDGSFYAQGMLGQYVYVHPQKNLIIVRLGYNWSHPEFYAEGFIRDLLNKL